MVLIITIVAGVYKASYTSGAPHCRPVLMNPDKVVFFPMWLCHVFVSLQAERGTR